MKSKNITLKIDEELYDRARMVAARRKTSISRLVRDYLERLDDQDAEREQQRVDALKRMWLLRDSAATKTKRGKAISFSREETYGERIR